MLTLLKREKGFTLIELMVVVLIIAILVAIAVPVFNIARSAAQRRTCQANLRTIDGAITTYKASDDSNAYPPAVDPLADTHVLVTEEYIKETPSCPTNDGTYEIVSDTPPYARCNDGEDGDPSGHSY